MGIYGSLIDKYGVQQPFLNASSLFLLALIIILTVWIPSFFSFCIMMLTFVGYRRESYDLYKKKRDGSVADSAPEVNIKGSIERLYKPWDWYLIIESCVFTLKKNVVGKDSDGDLVKLYTIDNANNLNITNEEDLDWFFPIRRSKMEWSCWNQDIADRFKNLFNFDFTSCKNDSNPKFDIGFSKKYYWYLSVFWYEPWQLINPMFTLNVSCDEIEKANTKSTNSYVKTFFFYLILSCFVPGIRLFMFFIGIGFLFALMVLIFISSILWTCIVITIAMYSIFIALLGNILALFYLHFYVIIGFFYVPIKHYPELFKIVKSHGNILTLLFCMIVVLAGVKVLHPTSVGVIGGILGLLIVYKLITLLTV